MVPVPLADNQNRTVYALRPWIDNRRTTGIDWFLWAQTPICANLGMHLGRRVVFEEAQIGVCAYGNALGMVGRVKRNGGACRQLSRESKEYGVDFRFTQDRTEPPFSERMPRVHSQWGRVDGESLNLYGYKI